MSEIDYDKEMRLPEGKTCGDCVNCKRCVAIFGRVPADTYCDFYPIRFRAVAKKEAAP